MQYCPRCGANVEGLTQRCDCCGMTLNPQISLFKWHTFMMQASGDLFYYANKVFRKLEAIDKTKYNGCVQNVELNLYCYPDEIICSEKLKNNVYFIRSSRKIRVNIVIDFNTYILGDSIAKELRVIDAVQAGVQIAVDRAKRANINIDSLLTDVEKLLSNSERRFFTT